MDSLANIQSAQRPLSGQIWIGANNSDRQNARIENDKALKRAITAISSDDAQPFKQLQDTTHSDIG